MIYSKQYARLEGIELMESSARCLPSRIFYESGVLWIKAWFGGNQPCM